MVQTILHTECRDLKLGFEVELNQLLTNQNTEAQRPQGTKPSVTFVSLCFNSSDFLLAR